MSAQITGTPNSGQVIKYEQLVMGAQKHGDRRVEFTCAHITGALKEDIILTGAQFTGTQNSCRHTPDRQSRLSLCLKKIESTREYWLTFW